MEWIWGIMTCSLANIWQTSGGLNPLPLARKLRSGVLIPDEGGEAESTGPERQPHQDDWEPERVADQEGQRPEQDHRKISTQSRERRRQTRPEHQNKEKPWRPICRQLDYGGGLFKVLGADLWVVWLHSRALSWWSASKCLTQRQRRKVSRTSLAVQSTSNAVGTDSLPGRGTKFSHVVCHGQNKL